MPFKQSLDLLRFIEKNRKKIKAKERDKAIEEGILKQEAKEAKGKRSKTGALKFETESDFDAYRDKIYEKKGTFTKEFEKRLKREQETESRIQDMIDSTVLGRPPRGKKYKKGGVPKFAAGGIKKFFIDPILGRIDGYSSKKEFDAAVKKFNKDNNVDDIPSSKDDGFEFQEYNPDIHGPADKPPVPSRKGRKTSIKKSIGGMALKGFKNKTPIY
tara:strand:- start:293 stop:937 length:645 start_codon:yes stop_codon:yes gene_type:complete